MFMFWKGKLVKGEAYAKALDILKPAQSPQRECLIGPCLGGKPIGGAKFAGDLWVIPAQWGLLGHGLFHVVFLVFYYSPLRL